MNQKAEVHAGVIKPKSGRETKESRVQTVHVDAKSWTDVDQAKVEQTESNVFFETLPMRIAHSRMNFRNRTVPALLEAFPLDRRLHHTELQFPYAKGGVLYVDEPRHPYNVELCERKAKAMKKAGLRYVYLVDKATYEEAILQLEGKL